MAAETGKQRIRQFYAEVASTGDVDRVEEFLTEDFVDHGGLASGRDGVRRFLRLMHSVFPDLRVEAESVMEEGDRVLARFRMTGTHESEFGGAAPTGRRIDVTGFDEVRMRGNRAAEHWGVIDLVELRRQLTGGLQEDPGDPDEQYYTHEVFGW